MVEYFNNKYNKKVQIALLGVIDLDFLVEFELESVGLVAGGERNLEGSGGQIGFDIGGGGVVDGNPDFVLTFGPLDLSLVGSRDHLEIECVFTDLRLSKCVCISSEELC